MHKRDLECLISVINRVFYTLKNIMVTNFTEHLAFVIITAINCINCYLTEMIVGILTPFAHEQTENIF